MKRLLNILLAVVAGVLFLIVIDTGLIQRTFDGRSIIEDAIVGSDYYIVSVDNKPADRIKHGFLITKVPFVLVQPGDHTLQLTRGFNRNSSEIIELNISIISGVNYRITTKDGKPMLTMKEES